MKVLLVNTYDRGGAANSCKRLHYGLLTKNIDSKILLRHKENHWSETFIYMQPHYQPSLSVRIINKIKRLLKKPFSFKTEREQKFLADRTSGLEMFSFPKSRIDITTADLYHEADIINLHWVANFLDFQSFFQKSKKPVVWTLHDMNPLSGGDHYEEKFLGIDEAGFPKRREISAEEGRFSAENLMIKKKVLARVNNLTIVAPSKWLAAEAAKSEVFKGKKVLHIPYGLDSKIFYPKDRNKSRELFNIPEEKKVILFVADSLVKNRKGLVFLKKAFELLKGENFLLCAVGSMPGDAETGKNILELGIIEGEEHMCAAYSAADVFVIPSLMDNLPNTALESIMCGTPVIGFPVGGIPEIVSNGENGLVTKEISVNSLHQTLVEFFNSIESFSREKIREDAVKKFDSKIQADRYISLFQEILEESQ